MFVVDCVVSRYSPRKPQRPTSSSHFLRAYATLMITSSWVDANHQCCSLSCNTSFLVYSLFSKTYFIFFFSAYLGRPSFFFPFAWILNKVFETKVLFFIQNPHDKTLIERTRNKMYTERTYYNSSTWTGCFSDFVKF